MNRCFSLLLGLLLSIAGCSSTPQRAGSRERINEKSIALESVRYQVARQSDGIVLEIHCTISADVETIARYQREVRTITGGWVDEVGPVFSLFALPFTLAADVITLGQHKKMKSEERPESKERRNLDVPAPEGAQVNGYLVIFNRETRSPLLTRSVSLPVKGGKVMFALPRDAKECVAVSFQGDLMAYGKGMPLTIDERLGCENNAKR